MKRYLLIWNTIANGNNVFMRELNEVRIFGKSNKKLIDMIKNGIDGVRLIRLEKYEKVETALEDLDYYKYYYFETSKNI